MDPSRPVEVLFKDMNSIGLDVACLVKLVPSDGDVPHPVVGLGPGSWLVGTVGGRMGLPQMLCVHSPSAEPLLSAKQGRAG